MTPRRLFVVEDAVSEAAVEDPDEPVGQCPKSAVVCVAGPTSLVIEGPGAGLAVRVAKAQR